MPPFETTKNPTASCGPMQCDSRHTATAVATTPLLCDHQPAALSYSGRVPGFVSDQLRCCLYTVFAAFCEGELLLANCLTCLKS